jgi:hypothetical protein
VANGLADVSLAIAREFPVLGVLSKAGLPDKVYRIPDSKFPRPPEALALVAVHFGEITMALIQGNHPSRNYR